MGTAFRTRNLLYRRRKCPWSRADERKRMDDTLDAIFDGRIKIFQSRTGYRFSLDTLLLADFAQLNHGETVVDLGAATALWR